MCKPASPVLAGPGGVSQRSLARGGVAGLLSINLVAALTLAAQAALPPGQQALQPGQFNRSPLLDTRQPPSALSVVASGSTTPRSLAEHWADRINVKDFGAKGDGIADDSAAFAHAMVAQRTRMANGIMTCLYAPASIYMLKATRLPTIAGPACIEGDGALHTIVKIDPAYSGDVLSFSEAWPASALPFNGATPDLSKQKGGVILRAFSIMGNRSTKNAQNAIVFYDRDEFVQLQDIDVDYVKGRALAFGLMKNRPLAFIQESRITRVRFLNDGAPGVPVVEFTAAGPAGTEGSGEINVDSMDIYANYGPGIVIRNAAKTHLAVMRFSRLRIEGLENNPPKVNADLLVVGDPTETGVVDGLVFRQVELLDPYAGNAALRITAPTAAAMPHDIDFEGVIGGGAPAGKGLVIEAGRAMHFRFNDIYTKDTEVTVGAPPLVGSQISIDGAGGREDSWTYKVDPSSAGALLSIPLRIGNPGDGKTLSLALSNQAGSVSTGGMIGKGAIDLQASDRDGDHTTIGNYSALLAGFNNTASGGVSAVLGGSSNHSSAVGGSIIGSSLASDRGRAYSQAYASGGPDGLASGQAGRQAMFASGRSEMRLTASGAAANSPLSPIMNIPPNTSFNLSIRLIAIDRTKPSNSYAETIPIALLTRGQDAGSTSLLLGKTDGALYTGTGAQAEASGTADKANGGLNLSFTPPQGMDIWDAFADVSSAEVR